jgi:hypothetical protein
VKTAMPSPSCFEDRLLEELTQVVAGNPAPAPDPGREPGQRRRRLVLVAVPLVALVVATCVVVPSLSGSPTATAQAAMIARASAAALEQPHTITFLAAKEYGPARGAADICLGMEIPIRCLGFTRHAGTSPALHLSFTYRQWISAGGRRVHTIYGTGDEYATTASVSVAYDPADRTLTTGDLPSPPVPSSVRAKGQPVPVVEDPTVADLEQLYRDAEVGRQGVALVRETTLGRASVYELRVTYPLELAPLGPHACGAPPCKLPTRSTIVYVDTRTFLPVRLVQLLTNRSELRTAPSGTSVLSRTDFVAHSLPGTPTNQRLLAMSAHPGARRVHLTQSRWRASLGHVRPQFIPQGSAGMAN